jgi:CHAT domain-containing protein/Tfp pilus assembly protein PilF
MMHKLHRLTAYGKGRLSLLLLAANLALLMAGLAPSGAFAAANQQVTRHPGLDYSTSLSKNGRFMAFVSDRGGSHDIWLKDLGAAFSGLRRVTSHPAGDFAPALSADGGKLLYVSHKADPRGDIYLLDLTSRIEERLTDVQSVDADPVWGWRQDRVYYLRRDIVASVNKLVCRTLADGTEEELLEGATSFALGADGWLFYSDGARIWAVRTDEPGRRWPVTSGEFRDDSPFFAAGRLFFTRYQSDTNGDGQLDADDESSIWMALPGPDQTGVRALYQVTPAGNHHLFPSAAADWLHFTDLRRGDVFRLHIGDFLADYLAREAAEEQANDLFLLGRTARALMMLGNISRNLSREMTPEQRALFDFSYLNRLRDAEKYGLALAVVQPYVGRADQLGARARIHRIALDLRLRHRSLGRAELRKQVGEAVAAMLDCAAKFENVPLVTGTALLEAGDLHLLAGDTFSALDRFSAVDVLPDEGLRAQALFGRSQVYRYLKDEKSRLEILAKVARLSGENSAWGKRAEAEILAVAQKGADFREQISALRATTSFYPDLVLLNVSMLFLVSELQHEHGENRAALTTLEELREHGGEFPDLLAKGLWRQADILAELEEFDQAIAVYRELRNRPGTDREKIARALRLMVVLQVRGGAALRDAGDVPMAAKRLGDLVRRYPESVEAHREYVQAKVMLGKRDQVVDFYREALQRRPNDPVWRYGLGLALTYAEKPDFPRIIDYLAQAVRLDPGVAYYHQTLGWAYEQYARVGGESVLLTEAARSYLTALELLDPLVFPEAEANLLLNLGNIFFSQGNHAEAYKYYRQREMREHRFPTLLTEVLFRRHYGESCFKIGRNSEAIDQYLQALAAVPEEMAPLRLELLERLALSYQDLGNHVKAVQYFSEALAGNLALAKTENLAILRRNIGVNLFNLGMTPGTVDRRALKNALGSFFQSLETIRQYGTRKQVEGQGLVNIELDLSVAGTRAAGGFDRPGEEKLLFGYLASTYEALAEAVPARAYYLKKLAYFPPTLSPQKDAALLTEKAVILNRLGGLSYSLGRLGDALAETWQALVAAKQLGLHHGLRVNLCNISKIMVAQTLAGESIDLQRLHLLTRMAEEEDLLAGVSGSEPRQAFFILSNLAFVFANLPAPPAMAAPVALKETVGKWHSLYTLRGRAFSYYLQAQALLDNRASFTAGEALAHLLRIKMNLLEMAGEAGKEAMRENLRREVAELASTGLTEAGWIYYLLQAEKSQQPARREALFARALAALVAMPPQVAAKVGNVRQTVSFLERLATGYTEQLLARGAVVEAFGVSEALRSRTASVMLTEALGREFFLQGLGPFASETGKMLADLEESFQAGEKERFAQLTGQWQELLFALYEEYPWAVSHFFAYPLSADLLGRVLTPTKPYLQVRQGTDGRHLFFHNGETVAFFRVAPAAAKGDVLPELIRKLAKVQSLYLSCPAEAEGLWLAELLADKSVTRVAHGYDILNGWQRRGLFHNRLAIAGDCCFAPANPFAPGSLVVRHLENGDADDQETLAESHIFITDIVGESLTYPVRQENEVHEWLNLRTLTVANGHTAMVRAPVGPAALPADFLASALIRTGFPHVVVYQGSEAGQPGEDLIRRYLENLADYSADDAFVRAVAVAPAKNGVTTSFRLYGYAGMNPEERGAMATARFDRMLAQSVRLNRQGNLQAAATTVENMLSILTLAKREDAFPQLTKFVVNALFKSHDYDRALFHQQQLVTYLEGADPREVAQAAYTLGKLYSRLEQYEPALRNLERAAAIWAAEKMPEQIAEGLATIGVVKENMGAYGEALDYFSQSFSLSAGVGQQENMAAQYRRIGRIYYLRLGRYEKAREYFQLALTLLLEAGDRRGEAEALYEIGLTFQKVGAFEQGNNYFAAGKKVAETLADPFLLAKGELFLANTDWYRGDYQPAFERLIVAADLAERAADPQLFIMIQNTWGLIYWTLNDPEKGLMHIRQAETVAVEEKIPGELATSYNNMGQIYLQQEEWQKALAKFQQAREVDERLKTKWGLSYDFRNIGIVLVRLGRLGEAQDYLLRSERLSREIKNPINQAKALLELGNLSRLQGENSPARSYYNEAYTLAQRHGLKEVLWRAAAHLAALEQRTGRQEEAVAWYGEAVTVVEGMRATLKIDELKNSFQENKEGLYRDFIVLLVGLGRPEEAFNCLERFRSRNFIDLIGNQKISLKSGADDKELETIAGLFRQVDELVSELAGFGDQPPSELVERYRQAKNLAEEAQIRLIQKNPELSSFVTVAPLSLAQFEKVLPAGVGTLAYMVTPDQTFIWLCQNGKTLFRQVDGGMAEVAALVETYRQRVQNFESVEDPLARLYQLLIQPVEAEIGQFSSLGIIPDGPLLFLSFAALKNKEGYLIDRLPLFYSPSASALQFTIAKRQPERGGGGGKVLALGNPDLGSYNYDLPLAELEAESIRWSRPEVDVLVREKATKEWLIDHISSYDIIHIAAHGEFQAINPLFSSLWLASTDPKNRRLTMKEVFALDIKADLVTLSACQTGLGVLRGGEIIGMNRAFMYAGTHSLISSLWRVDDLATALLMKYFYRYYKTMNKAESLRQAQLLVKKSFPHPAYWAGFTLQGDYQ